MRKLRNLNTDRFPVQVEAGCPIHVSPVCGYLIRLKTLQHLTPRVMVHITSNERGKYGTDGKDR